MRRLFQDCKKKISVEYITITNYDLSIKQHNNIYAEDLPKLLSVIYKPRIRNAKSTINAASFNRLNTVLLLRKEVTTDVRLFYT